MSLQAQVKISSLAGHVRLPLAENDHLRLSQPAQNEASAVRAQSKPRVRGL